MCPECAVASGGYFWIPTHYHVSRHQRDAISAIKLDFHSLLTKGASWSVKVLHDQNFVSDGVK